MPKYSQSGHKAVFNNEHVFHLVKTHTWMLRHNWHSLSAQRSHTQQSMLTMIQHSYMNISEKYHGPSSCHWPLTGMLFRVMQPLHEVRHVSQSWNAPCWKKESYGSLWQRASRNWSHGRPCGLAAWHSLIAVHLNRLAPYLSITKDAESWRMSTVMGAEDGDLCHMACAHPSFWFLLLPTPSMRLSSCINFLLKFKCISS